MGESLPYVLGRIDEGWRLVGGQGITSLKKLPSQYIKENIMITTSGLYYPETMLCAIKALGADRIMWAVDYPRVKTCEVLSHHL
jgi:predicted TIM-barrel fold metal-dependent hydrolase